MNFSSVMETSSGDIRLRILYRRLLVASQENLTLPLM